MKQLLFLLHLFIVINTQMKKLRIALVDDHTIVREGFKIILNASDFAEVVCEAADGIQALSELAKNEVDILITDVYMPNMNGIQLCTEAHILYPKLPILILSMYNNKEYFMNALRAGASGYLLKDCDKEELLLAIKKITKGENYYSNNLSNTLVKNMFDTRSTRSNTPNELTNREKDVLQLLVEGFSSKGIATHLAISPRTVDKHRENLMKKFGVNSVVELMNYVMKNNIIDISKH
jgi:DNA-binding NarL/FixJ family response regulator